MNTRNMSRARTAVGVVVFMMIVATTAGVWSVWPAVADDAQKPDLSLSAFMRKKLDASSQILEGLTTEDAELIKKGAATLTQLSKAEKWQILADRDYREYSGEFRTNARKLTEAAEKGNFDNAALQWFSTVKGCIECHQHVRREQGEARKKEE